MKVLALILTFYISFLTVQPVATHVCSAMMKQKTEKCCGSCCKKNKECRQKGKDDNNGCCMNICSSFGSFSGYYNSSSPSIVFPDHSISSGWKMSAIEMTTPAFGGDPFQPPEMI